MLPYRDSRFTRIILFAFFAAALAYGYYEVRNIFFGPSIEVPTDAITVYEPVTKIKGRAERITELRLNGKQIPVTESGEFEESYAVAEGSNRLILEASDARGQTTRKTIDIVYIPQAKAGE